MSNNLKQINDSAFLNRLVGVLKEANLSRIDLRSSGNEHRQHSALVENYEINIVRTPVFAYPNNWHRIFCYGRWVYQPDKYERYEVYVSENTYKRRNGDVIFPDVNNSLLAAGTMATGLGTYPKNFRFINRNSDCFDYLCLMQNPQLFDSARELYNILDAEYLRRQQDIRRYELPKIEKPEDLRRARMRVLDCLQRHL